MLKHEAETELPGRAHWFPPVNNCSKAAVNQNPQLGFEIHQKLTKITKESFKVGPSIILIIKENHELSALFCSTLQRYSFWPKLLLTK